MADWSSQITLNFDAIALSSLELSLLMNSVACSRVLLELLLSGWTFRDQRSSGFRSRVSIPQAAIMQPCDGAGAFGGEHLPRSRVECSFSFNTFKQQYDFENRPFDFTPCADTVEVENRTEACCFFVSFSKIIIFSGCAGAEGWQTQPWITGSSHSSTKIRRINCWVCGRWKYQRRCRGGCQG